VVEPVVLIWVPRLLLTLRLREANEKTLGTGEVLRASNKEGQHVKAILERTTKQGHHLALDQAELAEVTPP
jgi:hypothetical protein